MPRRKVGTVLPLEYDILEAGLHLQSRNEPVYGFSLARALRASDSSKGLTAHGTLYKALGRMAEAGLLEAVWEHPAAAEAENRPRRRLYEVTGHGAEVAQAERATVRPVRPVRGISLGPVLS
ncbi:hypothetical protein B7R22_14290 [Subtercola boreus]|uniref:Transcription regulator PadR N-terminal domain-containing protein n=1 Tax=Subtercola boreus TaxID=120213 RepID=A0A3E0VTU7_9MICO|nr:PadR family transcriptional regulator [Subtercola boreus]RFA13161.1 hypothetical protein B7R22_14290 [Subtercola boreus]